MRPGRGGRSYGKNENKYISKESLKNLQMVAFAVQ